MASSLILHKRIETTVAKAKELRKYIEPMITKSKTDSTNNRRVVFSYLQNETPSVSFLHMQSPTYCETRASKCSRVLLGYVSGAQGLLTVEACKIVALPPFIQTPPL